MKGSLRGLEFLLIFRLVDRIEQPFLQAVDKVGAHVLDALIEGLVKEQLLVAGPEIAAMSGKDFTQAEADQLFLGMRDSLKSVIKRLATE